MKPIVSVVMPYYNRLEQLYLTLKTIELSSCKNDVEIIILDDLSTYGQRACQIVRKFDLNIRLFEVREGQKWWANPCHLFNIGFRFAKGDTIVLQNPECFHLNDVLSHVFDNISDNKYLMYSCYNLSLQDVRKFWECMDAKDFSSEFKRRANQIVFMKENWYQHPVYKQRGLHFLSAINKSFLLEELNGFDERYSKGLSWDDNEFFERIKRSPLEILYFDPNEVCAIHQEHKKTYVKHRKCSKWKRNYDFFQTTTMKETGWKVNIGWSNNDSKECSLFLG